MKKTIVFLVGPTAIGKTEIGVRLAKNINAEVISCDSMQVYKGMDILTSKPSIILRKEVPHHLIGIISPEREYNVSRYRRDAIKKIKEILNKGKTPLFVGGSGLYMSILIDGIFKVKSNKNIRKQLYKQLETFGIQYLYERLKKIDRISALKIHPHDARRIIRALEVFEITGGQPISLLQKQREGLPKDYQIKIFCLNIRRDKLYKQIDERVEKMFACGLIREVKRLLKLNLSKTASSAIGIKELKGYFDGLYDLKESKRLMKRNTRSFAKRQLSWFRKDKRIKWIEINDKDRPKDIADKIWRELY